MHDKIALATGNSHKVYELNQLLKNGKLSFSPQILTPKDCGLTSFSPIEDGSSFTENSIIKSQALFDLTKIPSLADDSGIAVEALNGRPGIYSARYGGEGLSDKERALLLLQEMQGIKNRNAEFICVLSFTTQQGTITFEGRVSGQINELYIESGNGFGYDPIFFYPPKGLCFSELELGEKNTISHRALALEKFIDYLAESTGPPVNRL